MPNADIKRGLVPVNRQWGAPTVGTLKMFLCPSSDGVAMFRGDIAKLAGSAGAAATFVNGVNCEGMPTITKDATSPLTSGVDSVGVIVGFLPNQNDLSMTYRAASTNRIALVCVDPEQVYECQEDAVGTNIAAADVGLPVDYIPGTGNTTTGLSTGELDSSSAASNGTVASPLTLLGLSPRVDNAFGASTTDKAKFLVKLNEHVYRLPNAGA